MNYPIENQKSVTLPVEGAQPERSLRPLTFYVIVALVFAADQVSKSWIQKVMQPDRPRPIIGQSFLLNLTYNTGGAWGLLPRGNGLFIAFAAVAVFALLFAYHRMARVDVLVGGAFALALGGALGNLLDRLRFGHVVDFFDARIINWPIFNIADSAITLGIGLLVIHFLTSGRAEAANSHAGTPSGETASEPISPTTSPSPTRALAREEGASSPSE